MQQQGFTEADWKLFRSRIGGWQENYMEHLCRGYVEILTGDDNASDRFWRIEERIKADKKSAGVQCEMKRSNMIFIIVELIGDNVITEDDLQGFSDELRETIHMYLGRRME